MDKKLLEEIINQTLSTGADFSEVYYEDVNNKKYYYTNTKLDSITTSHSKGTGIRVIKDNNTVYGASNNLSEENLLKLAEKLASNFNDTKKVDPISLKEESKFKTPKVSFDDVSIDTKKELFKKIEETATKYSELITRVEVALLENSKLITIANSLGKLVKFNSIHSRLFVTIYAEANGKIESSYWNIGNFGGLELLNFDKYEEKTKETCQNAIEKLDAIAVKGGYYPVILGPAFGGVIFHEACGHGLEATSVADNKSVFCNKLKEKVASDKVTLIDDGTIDNVWGSIIYDDEGNTPQKNTLIENGILKSYLVDYNNSLKMNHKITGSGRRESYKYAPTSRMTNTYLKEGTSTLEEMIKSIDYGFYCKTMNGGSVECETGNFNFSVDDAFLIENGKITKRVKGASLIGTSIDILNNVEMVGKDLELGVGYCGSKSGTVPVTVGEPHIKVSKILIGGKEND